MTRSRADWEKLVAEYRRSGETQSAFCARRGVAIATLQYWLRKQRADKPSEEVAIVPVRVRGERAGGNCVEAELGTLRVRFGADAAPEYVAAVLRALASPC